MRLLRVASSLGMALMVTGPGRPARDLSRDQSPASELQEMLHLPHPFLVRDEYLGHIARGAKLGGGFLHPENKQLGSPEDVVLNHPLTFPPNRWHNC